MCRTELHGPGMIPPPVHDTRRNPNEKYVRTPCEFPWETLVDLENHRKTPRHHSVVDARTRSLDKSPLWCCSYLYPDQKTRNRHWNLRRSRRRLMSRAILRARFRSRTETSPCTAEVLRGKTQAHYWHPTADGSLIENGMALSCPMSWRRQSLAQNCPCEVPGLKKHSIIIFF
ncbi:hypothetical protein CC79DRAFT_524653 [Sarocladium strictum]